MEATQGNIHQPAPAGTSYSERRRAPRLPFRAVVEVLNMGDDPQVPIYEELVAGEAIDISSGGLRLRVPYDVREGAEVGLILRKGEQFQVFLAHVVWKMREGSSILYGLSAPRIEPKSVC